MLMDFSDGFWTDSVCSPWLFKEDSHSAAYSTPIHPSILRMRLGLAADFDTSGA